MKNNLKKLCVVVLIIILVVLVFTNANKSELKSVKNEKELQMFSDRYNWKKYSMSFIEKMLTLPFSVFINDGYRYVNTWDEVGTLDSNVGVKNRPTAAPDSMANDYSTASDYSKTNIQVEGVDEADVIKTDGNYIYSISEKKVIITDASNPENLIIKSSISDDAVPIDLLLHNDVLVVLSSNATSNYYTSNTIVSIYDIRDRSNPKRLKSFELYEKYNTTRCIDGNLYVFSKGYLRKENNKVVREYKEDFSTKEIPYKDIKYLKDDHSNIQTLIAEVDLNSLEKDIKVSSYLIDISNAYVSKNSIYLLDDDYYSHEKVKISSLFTLKGIFGIVGDNDDYEAKTKIYKFDIDKNKGVIYRNSTKLIGTTINQYSLDEDYGTLRIALESDDGTRIVVLNNKLKIIGETSNVAKGEKMYASRFMGKKAYLVTYQNTDPLFVVDLENPKKPKVIGELKIPGYSTYLHPYDDTHLIGIGMNTEEVIDRNIDGTVVSNWAMVTGMKMSLFDVSDINNPKEIDSTKIGDSRTVSAILTNPKALLFSREKNLLAIPVNNYQSDFSSETSENYEDEIKNYVNNKNYVSEGYLVYNVDLSGFKLKGQIIHEKENSNRYYYSYYTKLLRGLYIDDNLYTVSENKIKVNRLDDLTEISSLDLKNKGVN